MGIEEAKECCIVLNRSRVCCCYKLGMPGNMVKKAIEWSGYISIESVIIFYDNSSSIFITKNQAMHGITNHMDIKFHFLKDLVADGSIKLEFWSTNLQLADICTTALPNQKFIHLRSMLRMKCLNSREDVVDRSELSHFDPREGRDKGLEKAAKRDGIAPS